MNLKFIFACPSKYFPFPLLQDYSELQADKSLQPAKFLSNQVKLNKFLPPRATHGSTCPEASLEVLKKHIEVALRDTVSDCGDDGLTR